MPPYRFRPLLCPDFREFLVKTDAIDGGPALHHQQLGLSCYPCDRPLNQKLATVLPFTASTLNWCCSPYSKLNLDLVFSIPVPLRSFLGALTSPLLITSTKYPESCFWTVTSTLPPS